MNRKKGLDFVRAISALGIVAFHFYCHSSSARKLFFIHANGTWGGVLNYLFFAMSGLVLHLKYGKTEKLNLKAFYYKRWKAMMPAYLTVFAYVFMMKVFSFGRFFYMDIPKARLLLSLIGLDGYIALVTPTYFAVGEWFLGAILIAYIAYPLLKCIMEKNKLVGLIGLICAYAIFLKTGFLGFPTAANPATCMLCFYIGMLMACYPKMLERTAIVAASAAVAGFLLLIALPGVSVTKEMLIGFSLLITLNWVGERLCRCEGVYRGAAFVSGLSFYIFLIHHNLIYKVLTGFDSTSTRYCVGVLAVIILATLIFSHILSIVMKSLLGNRFFHRIEAAILKQG